MRVLACLAALLALTGLPTTTFGAPPDTAPGRRPVAPAGGRRLDPHQLPTQPPTGDTPELVDSLLRQKIDLALSLEAEREPRLDFHPLFTDELHFIVGAMHASGGRAIVAHALKPVVDRVFSFEEAPAAMHYMESGAHFGKVVIKVA